MPKVKVCILRTAGVNCDKETEFAFLKAGADTQLVHVNNFISKEKNINDYQILAIPGGFSYGDDIAAGKILANELKYKLIEDIKKFINAGKLIIGICNGFQILVKSGLLPGNEELAQETSLIINDSGKFEDRWVYLKPTSKKCIWT
ncbi:MAG: phosphoribosylformylglycinamidine synthase subunit PurQ, partial [Candidatus Omnitrophota bacterium]